MVVTHAVFFGEDRYYMLLTPVLAILAASACEFPRGLVSSRDVPSLAELCRYPESRCGVPLRLSAATPTNGDWKNTSLSTAQGNFS